MEDSPGTGKFTENPRVRVTCGEILPDGAIVDLVAAPDGGGLHLLLWNGKGKPLVSSAIDGGAGIFYQPPDLDPTVREAITFPSGAVEYGSVAELFAKVSNLYRDHLGLPEDVAAFATCWSLSSWIPELMLIPITLCIIGSLMRQICNLFRLFGALCRRPLPVAELSRRLPFFLSPTLLINDPGLSAKACASWRAANSHGLYVAGPGSTVSSLCCAKAVVLQPGDSPQIWGEDAMLLMLQPTDSTPLNNQALANIAAEFQPQLLTFRLRHLSGVDQFVSTTHPLAKFELVRNLGACVSEDPEIVRILTPLLESHQQNLLAQKSRDPIVAVVEALWGPSHDQNQITVGEITKRVNAILRSRGVNQDLNVREIGWKLRNLNLCTTSNGQCKELRFTGDTRYGIHRCVRDFGLQLPLRKDCDDCQGLQAAEQKPVK
jgi:hypothetical protein